MALGSERNGHVQTVKNNPSISKERQELDANELGGRNIVEYTKIIPGLYSREFGTSRLPISLYCVSKIAILLVLISLVTVLGHLQ